jgi:hypothetical protein
MASMKVESAWISTFSCDESQAAGAGQAGLNIDVRHRLASTAHIRL